MCCLHVCLCTVCIQCLWRPERGFSGLELGFRQWRTSEWVLGIELRSSVRAADVTTDHLHAPHTTRECVSVHGDMRDVPDHQLWYSF